jgi:hypothetical protein
MKIHELADRVLKKVGKERNHLEAGWNFIAYIALVLYIEILPSFLIIDTTFDISSV